MLNNTLIEMLKDLSNLKISMLNGSITGDKAKIEFNKIFYAANTIRKALLKNNMENSVAYDKIHDFISRLDNLKHDFKDVLDQVELTDEIIEEFKEHLPERIHTDASEEELKAETQEEQEEIKEEPEEIKEEPELSL